MISTNNELHVMVGNGCDLESQIQVDTSKVKAQCDNWKA